MPCYVYKCRKCGEFEKIQRITEDALKRCPTCRCKVERLITNTSFRLLGVDWFRREPLPGVSYEKDGKRLK